MRELDIKIEILKKKKDQECRELAFIEAEIYVDSAISAMLLYPIDDSLYAPPIPAKVLLNQLSKIKFVILS